MALEHSALGMTINSRAQARHILYASNLPKIICEHLIKYALMPEDQATNHWLTELSALFGDLKDGVAKTIQEKGRRVPYYKSMHFKVKNVMDVLNSNINSSALRSIERSQKYPNIRDRLPENFDQGPFHYGYSLTERRDTERGYVWILSYKGKPIWEG